MKADIRIRGGLLLPMDPSMEVIQDGEVIIREGRIVSAGPSKDTDGVDAGRTIDASGRIIMPGLVNCHTHLPMSMFRGLADDLPLDVWLNEHIFPAEAAHVTPENVEKWAAHSCHELIRSGITTCCDGYFLETCSAKAVHASGIRAVLGQGVIDFPAPGVPDPSENVALAVKAVEEMAKHSSRIQPSIFCHSPYTCSSATLKAAKKAADDLGVLFQIHVAETRNETSMINELGDRSIIAYLSDLGLLDNRTLLVHAVWISSSDIELIRSSGAGVAHCAESNMKLASGVAPVPELIRAGVAVGLGTDGCASNNDQDLFSEMDMVAKLHKVSAMDPCVMDARTTLAAATINGARAIGLGDLTGSLEPGKQADLILVNTGKPHMVPLNDPYSALVYSARASDVDLVMVDGDILFDAGGMR